MIGSTQIIQKEGLTRGFQLDNYALLELLGRGGEGTVWSAVDGRRQRIVALKIVPRPLDEIAVGQVTREFERQVHLIASLDHPHILPLYEFNSADAYFYFAMRYSSYGPLTRRLLQGPLSPDETLAMTAQIAAALTYLHQKEIVHRDLKPSNILLDSSGQAYLADFGLAKRLAMQTMALHTGRGTGPYAPYEQHMLDMITPQSDIYSLGVVVYEMLAGRLPWDGTQDLATLQLQKQETLPDLRQLRPDLPTAVPDVLNRMTAFNWKDRPATALAAYQLLVDAFDIANPPSVFSGASGDGGVFARDARHLLADGLADWQPAQDRFRVRLTNLAVIDAAYAQTGDGRQLPAFDSAMRLFVLRGALAHDYRLDFWWQRFLPDECLEACQQALANEDAPVQARAVARLLAEVEGGTAVSISTQTQQQLVETAVGGEQSIWREQALRLLTRTMPPATRWQPTAVTTAADAALAGLVEHDELLADAAVRLIGQMRSETAVQSLLHRESQIGLDRLLDALQLIYQEAGSLPDFVPMGWRSRVAGRQLRQQFLDDRAGLSWARPLIGLLAGLVAVSIFLLGWFYRPSAQLQDILLEPYPVSDIVTIVAVSDESLARYGRWDDWPRSRHAELVEKLAAAGAGVIVFDVVFDTETADDAALAVAMVQAGNVVQPVLGQGDAFAQPSGGVQYRDGVWPQPQLAAAGSGLGHANILHDRDGYVRRLPLVAEMDGEPVASLAVTAVQTYLGLKNELPTVENGRALVAGREIAVGDLADMSIAFAGPPAQPGQTTFRTVGYEAVLDGDVPADWLRHKIILIGITATAEPDRYLTPVGDGRPMYGVEILANSIESIWSNRAIRHLPTWAVVFVVLLLSSSAGLVCTRPWTGLLFAAGIALLYFFLASLLFDILSLSLDLFFPLLGIGLSYVAVTGYRFSVVVRRRRLAKDL